MKDFWNYDDDASERRIRQGLAAEGERLRTVDQEQAATLRKKAADDEIAGNNRMILAEYKRLGIEPIYAGNGILVTPTLARKLGAINVKI